MKNNFVFKALSILSIVVCAVCIVVYAVLFSSFQESKATFPEELMYSVCQVNVVSGDNKQSNGTAFLIRDNYVITNYHVVNFDKESQNRILLKFPNEKEQIEANIYSFDEANDLAILHFSNKIQAKPINISHENVNYGDECYALSNVNNYGISVLRGCVTMPSVFIDSPDYKDFFIQSNLDIYPGSSGGCLLNKNYLCIGLLTFRLKDSLNNPIYGYGYSIPSYRINAFLVSNKL